MRPRVKVKERQVKELVQLLKDAKVIAVVSLARVPASQLRSIRRGLKGVQLIVKPKNVFVRALKQSQHDSLIPELNGPCGLLLLDESAFKMKIKLSDFKVPAFARPGSIASEAIVLKEGPTPFMPGELMTALTDLGVSVNPKGGKINIMSDKVLVKAGEEISPEVAELLMQMNLKPVKVGLDVIASLEDGLVFSESDLSFDVEAIRGELLTAHAQSINLSLNAGIINEFTIKSLLLKGFFNAKNLSLEAGIVTKGNVSDLMLIAKSKVLGLASSINWEVK